MHGRARMLARLYVAAGRQPQAGVAMIDEQHVIAVHAYEVRDQVPRRSRRPLPPTQLRARVDPRERLNELRALQVIERADGLHFLADQRTQPRLARGLDRLRERLDREHDGDRSRWLAALVPLAAQLRPLTAAALGLIIGGAIGNAIDRFAYGAVVDFALFHVQIGEKTLNWYVFNLADVAIVAGVAALLYDSFLGVPAAKAP